MHIQMMMSKEIDALHIHITKQHCHAHSITLPVHLLLRHIHILAIFFFLQATYTETLHILLRYMYTKLRTAGESGLCVGKSFFCQLVYGIGCLCLVNCVLFTHMFSYKFNQLCPDSYVVTRNMNNSKYFFKH